MESMEIDSSTESVLRPNSLFLHGVDNLSTDDIKEYIKKFVDFDFKIEWINDTSLNVVFENDDDASNSLKKLSLHQDKVFSATEERIAQDFGKPEVNLTIRMSNLSDKKVKDAAAYSRYYLFNPPKHERERFKGKRRNESRGNEYREREPVVFKRSNRDDEEDDGEDLFPEKAAIAHPKREIRTNDQDNDSLMTFDEMKSKGSVQDDSLGKIGEKKPDEDRLNTATLFERIGQKTSFEDKKLDNDDLFS